MSSGSLDPAREPLAIAAAVFLPARPEDVPLLLSYRPPRTTVLLPLQEDTPQCAALALHSMAAPGVSVAVVHAGRPRDDADVRVIATLLPEATVLAVDPKEALRFLWFYRDHHDPMALGHACSRILLDASYETRTVPDIRAARRRRERRFAEQDLRQMVLETGAGLGVAPPLPRPAPASGGWSAMRLAGLLDACAGLYVILLHRWGSALASVETTEPGIRRVCLADEWLRGRRQDGQAEVP